MKKKLSHTEILEYIEKLNTLSSNSSLSEIQNILFDAVTGYTPDKKNIINLTSNK